MIGDDGFISRELKQLNEMVHAPTVTSKAEYASALMRAGFVDVHMDDMTKAWKPWTKARFEKYRASRDATIAMHGQDVYENRVKFYETIDFFGVIKNLDVLVTFPRE